MFVSFKNGCDTKLFLSVSIATYMGCRLSNFSVTYLDLSFSDKRLAKTDYLSLIYKIANILLDSSAFPLSMAEKNIIVNAVLSTLPIYFECFHPAKMDNP
jgi:hypothetical protein